MFKACEARGWNRIVLCGVSDLAEIASLRASEVDIEIIGIYDPHAERREQPRLVDEARQGELSDHDWRGLALLPELELASEDPDASEIRSATARVGLERRLREGMPRAGAVAARPAPTPPAPPARHSDAGRNEMTDAKRSRPGGVPPSSPSGTTFPAVPRAPRNVR